MKASLIAAATAVLGLAFLFFVLIIPGVMAQEYTYEVCVDTKKMLDADAQTLRNQSDSVERDLAAAQHNLAVQNFNIRCGQK